MRATKRLIFDPSNVFRLFLLLALIAGTAIVSEPAGRVSAEGPNAIVTLPTSSGGDGCKDVVLSPNDDGSSHVTPLGFNLDFFGTAYNEVYVNNNGNVTFDGPLSSYTPFDLTSTSSVIIAPFFGDVDTRDDGSEPVTYSFGDGTYGGRRAFCVNWVNVGYYSHGTDKLNSFQLVLIDRSDIAPGDFDIMMNYDKIQWESGSASGGSEGLGGDSARVGYSNGVDTSFELPGSAVNGAFLDSNTATGLIHNSRNSLQMGRYIFEVRNGAPPPGGRISGTITGPNNETLAGAPVQVCLGPGGGCIWNGRTNSLGRYTATGLADGEYTVTAYPPAGSDLLSSTIGPINITDAASITEQDIQLRGPQAPPPDTTLEPSTSGGGGLPVVYWGDPLELTTTGCAGGTASYRVVRGGDVVRSGAMAEGPAGTYTATIDAFYPISGSATIEMTITCPDPAQNETDSFNIYIDPSGNVRSVGGAPITGATVTLYRSDSSSGPFVTVPDGSDIMSPMNRSNPDTTDADGHFGWDVIAGYYKVRASKDGCHAPNNADQAYVESHVMTIPPPVTDLDLRLDCGAQNEPPTASAGGPYSVDEGDSVTLTASGSDPEGSALSYTWDLDNDGAFDDASGESATFSAAALDGPSSHTVKVQVTDPDGASDEDTATVSIANVAPVLSTITAPTNPVAVNTEITASANFTDAGTADTHTATIDWGDDSTSAGSVSSGTASGSHTYTEAGVYALKLTVTDDDGGADSEIFQYVVVYDPEAGFVTGGGWINSPAGAYAADPSLTGKANFGFVSRYKKGATTPSGQTQFQFHAGGLNFHSSSYEWLVISGPKAQYKGTGTVNGSGDYGFLLTANDGQVNGGGGIDRFRIKIWDKATGSVVYDNQTGDSLDADATDAIEGGSIVIHSK